MTDEDKVKLAKAFELLAEAQALLAETLQYPKSPGPQPLSGGGPGEEK